MSFLSYAQNFEDVILWRALQDVQAGHYLDIGAQDPNADSVSLAFYNAGWRGIHVEPTAEYAARLRQGRPDETVIEAAASDKAGPIEFWEIPETGLSTGKGEIADKHGKAGFQPRKLLVPCVSLSSLLGIIPTGLHWMKVDVEGMEADVLRSWGDSAARPWIVVVESTLPNSQQQTHTEWQEELLNRGYKEVLFDGLSRYFLHETQEVRAPLFESPANIFDDFVVQPEHFVSRLMRAELHSLRSELTTEQARVVRFAEQLDSAKSALDQARSDRSSALESLANAEREHRTSIHQLWADRQKAESSLRQQHAELISNLTDTVLSARSAEASAVARVVTLEGQAARLEERLDAVLTKAANEQAYLAREIDEHGKALMRASATIKRAGATIDSRWKHLLIGLRLSARPKEWTDLKEWPLAHAKAPSSQPARQGSAQGSVETTATMTKPTRNPYLRADSLAYLTTFNDVDFVRCAYVTILGRQPDPPGEAYYTRRLREGHSKLETLLQLRRSAEARTHDPGIAGLDRALKLAAWQRKPAVGFIVRAFTRGGERDDRITRLHRSIGNDLGTIKERLGCIDELASAIQSQPSAGAPVTQVLRAEPQKADNLITEVDRSPAARKSLQILLGGHSR